jgi:uncharacterized membrane protein (DUF2068 family)
MEHPPGAAPPPRRRTKVDWELVACGWTGHTLVGTDARTIRPEDHVAVRETEDLRWHRCLRCDSWVALKPPAEPATDHPPDRDQIRIPLRGRALRDRVVLRLIAVDRAIHFLLLTTIGIAVLIFAANEHSLRGTFYRFLTDLQRGVAGGPVQTSGHVGILHELDRLFSLRSGTLHKVGFALIGYGVLEGVEAVGLWYTKRWAEYLTFLATAALLPLEIYELSHRISALKLFGFAVNVAVVAYLIYGKRLFGVRGGGARDEAERADGMSWAAIERTTPKIATP